MTHTKALRRGVAFPAVLSAALMFAGCGAFDGIYKDRKPKCKVNCDTNSADADPRGSPRDTAPLSLQLDYWNRAYNDAAPSELTKLPVTSSGEALQAYLMSNPLRDHQGYMSLPALLRGIADGATTFEGVNPADENLTPTQRCLAEAFWAAPQATAVGAGGVLNIGRCITLSSLSQDESLSKSEWVLSYDDTREVQVDGQPSTGEHVSTLLRQAPFHWPVGDERDLALSFTAKKASTEDIGTFASGKLVELRRTFNFSALGFQSAPFRIVYAANAHTLRLDGSMVRIQGIVINPGQDTPFKGADSTAAALQIEFEDFTISGPDVRANDTLGISNTATLGGAFTFSAINHLPVKYRVQATGQKCLVALSELPGEGSETTAPTLLTTFDLCAR